MQASPLPSKPSVVVGPVPTAVKGRPPLAPAFGAATEPTEAVAGGLAAIAAAGTATGVYHAACALALRLSGIDGVAVLRQDERGLPSVAYAPASAGVSPGLVALAAGAMHQRWIAAHRTGAPVYGPGPFVVAEQPELLVVPFVRGDALIGALVAVGREGRVPAASKAERITATAIGTVAAQALEGLTHRRRLDRSISCAQHEAELAAARKGVSRELHDGPTQDLALAGMTLDRIVTQLGDNRAVANDALQARDLIDRAIQGMRAAIGRLRSSRDPSQDQGPSVTGPLREVLAEMPPAPGVPEVEVDFSEISGVHLAPEVERALVGIVREALHNVRKHANANTVQLEVRRGAGAVEVAVVDDGDGFNGVEPTGHFGLEQIRELAEGAGGRVEVGSLPGIGTSVRAWIPLPGGAPDGPSWAEALGLEPEPKGGTALPPRGGVSR